MLEYFWFDIIAVGVVILGAIIGMFRGFFATLLSLLGFVGIIIISYFFSDEVLALAETLFGFKTWICSVLGPTIGGIVAVVGSLGITFALIKLIIFILNRTIGAIFKGKLLGGINTFLGFFLGLVKGAAYVALALIVINIASLVPQVKTWADDAFSQTYVVGTVYNFLSDQIGDYFSNDAEETPEETPET